MDGSLNFGLNQIQDRGFTREHYGTNWTLSTMAADTMETEPIERTLW